jgi:hypothetical protein
MGGALNFLECFWYRIQWRFTCYSGIPQKPKINKEDDPTTALSSAGADQMMTETIKHSIEVTKGMRTLGVRLAPDGMDKDEYQYRLDEATSMRDRFHPSTVPMLKSASDRSLWKMKLMYPIGATCFTSCKQCAKIQARYLLTFLSKMGINRPAATAVRHGPQSLGGMDVFDLETKQAV